MMKTLQFLIVLSFALLLAGCGGGPELPTIATVRGKVLYDGKPLTFGGVMFQGSAGQPARAKIQSDGTFVLTTYNKQDGAPVGKLKVRVTCYEGQAPAAEGESRDAERPLGKLLIPKRYTAYATSGLEVNIPPEGNPDLVLELQP